MKEGREYAELIWDTSGEKTIGLFEYDGLYWQVTAKKRFEEHHIRNPICIQKLDNGKVCATELTQKEHLLYYTWSCSNCNFKKHTLEYEIQSSENVYKNLEGFIKRENLPEDNYVLSEALDKQFKEQLNEK